MTLRLYPDVSFPERYNPDYDTIPNVVIPTWKNVKGIISPLRADDPGYMVSRELCRENDIRDRVIVGIGVFGIDAFGIKTWTPIFLLHDLTLRSFLGVKVEHRA